MSVLNKVELLKWMSFDLNVDIPTVVRAANGDGGRRRHAESVKRTCGQEVTQRVCKISREGWSWMTNPCLVRQCKLTLPCPIKAEET